VALEIDTPILLPGRIVNALADVTNDPVCMVLAVESRVNGVVSNSMTVAPAAAVGAVAGAVIFLTAIVKPDGPATA
jgi:hypothetical protein